MVNLRVRLPKVDIDVDGIGLPTPSLPFLFAGSRAKGVASKTVEVVLAKLDWFEGLAAPSQCLLRIQPRLGRKGATKVIAAAEYLETLARE